MAVSFKDDAIMKAYHLKARRKAQALEGIALLAKAAKDL